MLSPVAFAGSKEAISAINRFQAGSKDPAKTQQEQLEEFKKQVNIAKDQLTELKEMNKQKQKIVAVALGGG